MIDLRNYRKMMEDIAASECEFDTLRKWNIKSVARNKVTVLCQYIMDEKKDCFEIAFYRNRQGEGDWLVSKTPHGDSINCYMVAERYASGLDMGMSMDIKEALQSAFMDVTRYAYSRD